MGIHPNIVDRYGGSLGQPNADNCPRDVWVEPAEVAKMICM